MSDALELPADIHDAITAHCAEGDRLADDGAFDARCNKGMVEIEGF